MAQILEVLHISPSYKPAYGYGGTTVSISSLCEALQRNRGNVTVFTTTANGKTELRVTRKVGVLVEGVPVHYFRRITKDHLHFSPSLYVQLYRHIKKRKQDCTFMVIHIHSWWNLVSMISCSIGLLLKVPVVVTPRGMLTNYTFGHKNEYIKRLTHTIVGKRLLEATHIHATSDKEKHDILEFLQPKGITVIPNLLADFVRVKESTIPVCPFKMIFLSRIDKKKGLEVLFEAVAKLKLKYHLTIAGTGPKPYIFSLKALAQVLGIGDSISWIGQVDREEKYTVLSSHHLFVLASHNENFGNAVLESLSVGTPVLITEQVGLSDYIIQSGLGWVCKQDPYDVARHITNISAARDRLGEIKNKAAAQVRADFNTHALVNRYQTYYRNCSLSNKKQSQIAKNTKVKT
jgi:glycosyltransferase involved in cell wall biosynthesis